MPYVELSARIPDFVEILTRRIRELGGKARLPQILERLTWQMPSRKDLFGDVAFGAVVALECEPRFLRLDEAPGDWWTLDEQHLRRIGCER